MKRLILLLTLLLTACTNPDIRPLVGKTLWTKQGCAYVVTQVGVGYGQVAIHRNADADHPTCKETP